MVAYEINAVQGTIQLGGQAVSILKNEPLGQIIFNLMAVQNSLDYRLAAKLKNMIAHHVEDKNRPDIGRHLSSRGRDTLFRSDPHNETLSKMKANHYSATNPEGNINFCVAQNNICTDLIESRLRNHPEIYTPDLNLLGNYGPGGGYKEIKSTICKYLKEEYSPEIKEEGIIFLPAGNTVYDVVGHCIMDPHDMVLAMAPAYSRNFVNVSERAELRTALVDVDLQNPRININDFERVYKEQTAKGENVRAVIIINPNNPLGVIWPLEDMKILADWCHSKDLWFLSDESYSQCVYGENVQFDSFVKIQADHPVKGLTFWSMSKDFGLPGLKFSINYTNDRELHKVLCQLEITGPVSSLAQNFANNFLQDRDWLQKFRQEKLHRLRLQSGFITRNFKILGIPTVASNSGVYLYVDFRKKLRAQTFEAEEEFWREMMSKGVYMTPGQHTKCKEPGWFRLVFACEKSELIEGIRRLYELFGVEPREISDICY